MKVRLYTLPASHPGMTAKRMLEHKGIPYTRVDLLPGLSSYIVRALRFHEGTVPAMVIDGRRVQGSRTIAQELERLKPEPPLFPADADQRAAVRRGRALGRRGAPGHRPQDHALGGRPGPGGARSAIWRKRGSACPTASRRRPADRSSPSRSASTTRPKRTRAPRWRSSRRSCSGSTTEIAAGTIGGEELNAADYQVAASMRLACSRARTCGR